MSWETAKAAIDYILSHEDDFREESVIWDFIGGEPFMEIDLIDKICDYLKTEMFRRNHHWFNSYRFSFSTNGINYHTDKVQEFIKKNHTHLSVGITIDGTERKHDLNRIYKQSNPDGSEHGSYRDVVRNIPLWLEQFPSASTKVTISSADIPYIKESVLHLYSLGIHEVNINCVFEDVWREGDDRLFEEQLMQLADDIIDGGWYQDYACSFFSEHIGKPLLCELPNMQEKDMAVLELSSFQLHSMTCRPHTAVITNISPNHLDKHKDFQDYIDAKRSIFLNQQAEDRLILFADDEHSAYYASQAPSRVSWFSDTRDARPGCLCREGRILWVSEAGEERYIMNADEIRIPGQHNVRNYLAAFEAVRGLVSPELCRETARAFAGVEHRLEEVRVFRGVRYINDSIASSPTRTIAGLRALKTRPIILLGGYDKHLPFDSLGDEVCKQAKAAIVAGDTAERIIEAIEKSGDNHGFPVYRTENMTESVKLASRIAEAGDTVILSPACASFDQFRNFEERGRCFKRLVMELE